MKDQEKLPVKGDKMYVDSSFYMYRGEDDFVGGIATVEKIMLSDHLPEDHCNYVMVVFQERLDVRYNYRSLLEKQNALKIQFGDQISHSDPDDRSEFNDDHSGWGPAFGKRLCDDGLYH